MIESPNLSPVKRGSERSLGIVFFFVFLFFGVIKFENNYYNYVLISLGFLFLFLAILKPNSLKALNIIWFNIGVKLGGIIAPLVMLLVYIVGIVPISFILFLLRYDLLRLKKPKDIKTYWIKRKIKMQSMKDQF